MHTRILIHKNVTDHLIQVTMVFLRPDNYDVDFILSFIQQFLNSHINTGSMGPAAKKRLFVALQDSIVQSAISQLDQ